MLFYNFKLLIYFSCPYTDEERKSVRAALTGVARLECYKIYMEAACREYVAAIIGDLSLI